MSKSIATVPAISGDAGKQATTSSIHLSLQGKGGVGKSLVASILAKPRQALFDSAQMSANAQVAVAPLSRNGTVGLASRLLLLTCLGEA